MLKPYKYKRLSKRKPVDVQTLPLPTKTEEGLTGWVNGLRASDLEERLARAFRKKQLKFVFKFDTLVPGDVFEKEIDYVVNNWPVIKAIEVYGPFSHEGQANIERDLLRASELNPVLISQGIEPIEVVWYYDIQTSEDAEIKVQELFF